MLAEPILADSVLNENLAKTFLVLVLAIGVTVLLATMFLLLLAMIWMLAYAIAAVLFYTSSVQLLIIGVVSFEAYRTGQHYLRKRGIL